MKTETNDKPVPHAWQEADVQAIRAGLQEHRSVLYQAPTGSGKTIVCGTVCDRFSAGGGRVLILVHRIELVHQFIATLKKFGLDKNVGVIARGFPQTPWAPIQVGMVISVARRQIDTWFKPHLIVVDEAHHCRAKTWETVFEAYPRARIFGMTATPRRLDGLALNAHFEHMVRAPEIAQLIEWGNLAPVRTIRLPPAIDLKKLKRQRHEYTKASMSEAGRSPALMASFMRNYQEYGAGRQCLYFAPSVEHSMKTAEQLRDAGVQAEHVDGTTPPLVRRAIFDRFSAGVCQVICNVNIASEGTDLPGCEVVIDGAATLSVVNYMQRLGRASRTSEGKTEGLYVDLVGNEREHGPWDADRRWTLDDGLPQGELLDPKEKSKWRVCKKCHTVFGIRESFCPGCGEIPKVREVEELDIKLEPADGKPVKKRGRREKSEFQKRLSAISYSPRPYADLLELAADRGYPPSWAKELAKLMRIPAP